MATTVVNSITTVITIDSQASAQTLWDALNYVLNNDPTLSSAQQAELNAVRTALATVF